VSIRNFVAFFMALLLCACQSSVSDNEKNANADSGQLVARYDGHEITVAEVDARILALPRSERPKPGADLDAWFEQQTREVAMDALLRADARKVGVAEEEEFLGARGDIEVRLGAQLCIAALHPDDERVTPAEVKAAYEARHDEFSLPERRSALYIFKRRGADGSADAARAEIEALRLRVLGGESFSQLATDHSDSETRHQGGSLGWLTAGELPASLDKVIFSLEEGVPSAPLVTREGVHLFYVQKILPSGTRPLKDVRKALRSRLITERRMKALTELESDTKLPPDSLVLDRKSFNDAMNSGNPKMPVLRIDGRELSAGGMRLLLAQASAQGAETNRSAPGERAWQIYQATRLMSQAYQQCRERGLIPTEQLAERVGDWEDKALLRLIRQRRMLELAASDEQKMRSFYEGNVGQFSTPPKWRLRHLSIPIGKDALSVMTDLEKAAAEGGTDSKVLAARFGGNLEEWESGDLSALAARDSRLGTLVSPLAVGQLSAPYRTEKALELVEVLGREDAVIRPFDQVRVEVTAAYVKQYTSDVYQRLSARMLAESHFAIVPHGLARLRATGMPQAEVSVEELESMIEQL
jgi:parvulin-like peptidyl-prolyl isomerase